MSCLVRTIQTNGGILGIRIPGRRCYVLIASTFINTILGRIAREDVVYIGGQVYRRSLYS